MNNVSSYDFGIGSLGIAGGAFFIKGACQAVKSGTTLKSRIASVGMMILGATAAVTSGYHLYQKHFAPIQGPVNNQIFDQSEDSFQKDTCYLESFQTGSYISKELLLKNPFKAYTSSLTDTKQCSSPEIYLNLQKATGNYFGIDKTAMESIFQFSPRSLKVLDTRNLYNDIVHTNVNFAMDAYQRNILDPMEIARAASNTRHEARLFTRETGSWTAHTLASIRDRLLNLWYNGHLSGEGLTFEEITKKYNYNALKIIEKSADPNQGVNGFAHFLSKYIPWI